MASLAATLLVAEGALRFVLFADVAQRTGFGWRLRNESLYSPREAGREAWKLRAFLGRDSGPPRSPFFDARFGWLGPEIDRVTLDCVDAAPLAGRRPVLLFGDSYARCVADAGVCWQHLLEESSQSARFCLLNYGVGGFGLDQVHLLMSSVLERWVDRDPVVIVGVLVDDDLDRTYLGLRPYPKPYFTLDGPELVLHPLEHEDVPSYLRAHPVEIRSYLWRLCLFGSGLVPRQAALAWTGESDHVAEKSALCRRLMLEMKRTLEERGLTHFFLLFHARGSLGTDGSPPGIGWQEPFLHQTLAELGIPFVSSKTHLLAELRRGGGSPEDFFFDSGRGRNHYTGAANRAVFRALLDGLEGRFEPSVER